jgi:hypothetical protein
MAAKAPRPELDDETVRIARNLLNTPPKPHEEMKLGKGKAKKRRTQRNPRRRDVSAR